MQLKLDEIPEIPIVEGEGQKDRQHAQPKRCVFECSPALTTAYQRPERLIRSSFFDAFEWGEALTKKAFTVVVDFPGDCAQDDPGAAARDEKQDDRRPCAERLQIDQVMFVVAELRGPDRDQGGDKRHIDANVEFRVVEEPVQALLSRIAKRLELIRPLDGVEQELLLAFDLIVERFGPLFPILFPLFQVAHRRTMTHLGI